MLFEFGPVELTSFVFVVGLLNNIDIAFEVESSPYKLINLLIADIISHPLEHFFEMPFELD